MPHDRGLEDPLGRRGGLSAGGRKLVLRAAEPDAAEFERVLIAALGRRWGNQMWVWARQGRPEAAARRVRQLRRAVRWRALTREPLTTLAGPYRHYRGALRLYFRPPLPWLAVLGPDGSGKSTTLAGLCAAWPPSLGPVHRYHLRPRRLSRRGASDEPVLDPHAAPPRGPLTSAAALAFVVADWWLGYWTEIAPRRARQGLVVFDRHLLDVLVDPRRYRYGGPAWLARLACAVVPRPDVIIVLDASPAVVRGRKQEVTAAESRRQREEYRRLAESTPGAHLVDAAASPSRVVESVMAIVQRHVSGRVSVPSA